MDDPLNISFKKLKPIIHRVFPFLLFFASIAKSYGGAGIFINDSSLNFAYEPDTSVINQSSQTVTVGFNTPDTVCQNTTVTIKNITTGGTSFYWNFCDPALNSNPTAVNIGNPGNLLSRPTFIDMVSENGSYYGFVVDYVPGKLIRLDFGNSLLNLPTAISLGNFGGIIPVSEGAEGIRVIQNEGKWYAIIVAGDSSRNSSRIIKIDFGPSITNTSPVATNWGNLGNMLQPIDFSLFKDGINWYGFTVNAENNTITRFDFTNSFENTPVGYNLGNLGNLHSPTGIFAINDSGFWRMFITNGWDNSSITRLDFGSSLVNSPTAVNLGNIGNTLKRPRDIYIIKLCGETVGFVVNGRTDANDIVKLNFTNGLDNIPVATSLGNLGNLNFPHSISKLFRVGSDLYSFIANANNNTITRLKFTGCNSLNIPNSTDSIAPAITYNQPGTYNINLMVDEGLATQTSFCKSIVVLSMPAKSPLQNLSFCNNDSVMLVSPIGDANYTWNNGSNDSFIYVKQSGIYWVKSGYYNQCTVRDSFNCIINPLPNVFLGNDTSFCSNNSIILDAGNSGATYLWQDSSSTETYKVQSSGVYNVIVTDANNCSAESSVTINVLSLPDVTTLNDTFLCNGSYLTLNTVTNTGKTFLWRPSIGLSNSSTLNPIASPSTTTKYVITVTSPEGCSSEDSITINVLPSPSVKVSTADTLICIGTDILISASSPDAIEYTWYPATGLSSNSIPNPIADPTNSTKYHVQVAASNGCTAEDSVMVNIKQKPLFAVAPLSAAICTGESVVLTASGGDTYQWYPSTTAQSPTSASTAVYPLTSTTYKVVVTDNICNITDSLVVTVILTSLPNTTVSKSNDVDCVIGEAKLAASGGVKYFWWPASSLSNSNIANPFARPTETTTYHVKINDGGGCYAEDSIEVKVLVGKAENGYLLPSAFTPNNDGYNDCFGVKKWGYVTDLDFTVYNRWGNVVFHTSNPENCWDGTFNGIQQPSGSYVYQIRAKAICGSVYRKGVVVLMR